MIDTLNIALGKASWSSPWLASARQYLSLAETFQAHLCVYSSWASPLYWLQIYIQMAQPVPTTGLFPEREKLLLANTRVSSWLLTECAVLFYNTRFPPKRWLRSLFVFGPSHLVQTALWLYFSLARRGFNWAIYRYTWSRKEVKGNIMSGATVVVSLERRNVHSGCFHVDGRAHRRKGWVMDTHRHAGEVLGRLSSVSVHSCASIADAHDERTANTACCRCG